MHKHYPRISKVLEEKKISKYKFAQMLGVHKNTLYGWLNGRYEPGLDIIEKSAELLDISIDEVIFECNKKR